ncbi:hypothetical protein [[Clostridium] polysaccharolyticum]|uniref:Replication restart DNA helicase PriA n=1 Tax=[Clostridium] polysaccharolyticum TaxID=29364 RepID=A0A1I0DU57_9FIRM|nr:hypothetical protein [[Clostridium] polysaccharolyticum]SET35755.1 replication restart DNA helicase PriA [[Clostridium] polysaccharolyticum]
MILQHKCPDCGADMQYDADSRLLKCPSCGKTQNIKDMEPDFDPNAKQSHDAEASADDVDEVYGDFEDFEEQSTYGTYEDNEAKHYICQNCGAELITDADTTATICSYCNSPMILGDRLSGKMAPSKVIPFTISKERAEETFKKWCKHGLITPKDFTKADRISSITGMYVPFWLYDVNGRGEAHAHATKVRHYTSGDYDVTETRHYQVYRKVSLNFNDIPADASEKMPDDMMDKLEPYTYQDLTDFNTPYLSGFIAEKYNYTDAELFPRIKQKTEHYMDQYISNTITGYSSVTFTDRSYDTRQKNAIYSLLPVWMLSYNFNGKNYLFAMNGQTGKVVGKPPVSKGKVALWWGSITLVTFLISFLITMAAGGAF